jgi:hypothetical protein
MEITPYYVHYQNHHTPTNRFYQFAPAGINIKSTKTTPNLQHIQSRSFLQQRRRITRIQYERNTTLYIRITCVCTTRNTLCKPSNSVCILQIKHQSKQPPPQLPQPVQIWTNTPALDAAQPPDTTMSAVLLHYHRHHLSLCVDSATLPVPCARQRVALTTLAAQHIRPLHIDSHLHVSLCTVGRVCGRAPTAMYLNDVVILGYMNN